MRASKLFLALGLLALGATAAIAQSLPAGVQVSGGILTDSKGMTLYTWDNDKTPGQSSCMGNCLKNWPALMAPADAKGMGDWTVITRNDGSKQWAYKGKPLYGWVKDQKPGDTTGNGFLNGAWHVAKP